MTGGLVSPRAARRLLAWTLPADVREPVVGDLEEVFRRPRRRDGVLRAQLWFWREAASFSVSFMAAAAPPWRRPFKRPPSTFESTGRGGRGMRMGIDLREAGRSFIRRPLFTAAVVFSLAFGIGATTAIFSLVHALILRSLPVHDPGALFRWCIAATPARSTARRRPFASC
jgi:hypothetical protein